ncbi:MAG TPA: GIY-YIG nuclease family protein [Verrucomicrobiae bacterium]|nr:GIY-YIG nuclease family protein [Verrucomicrobiae bacterium]
MTDEQLAKLIQDDDQDLLKVKPKRTPQSTEEERLLDGFQQILRFVETNGAPPAEFAPDLSERLLFAKLNAIRSNRQQCEKLLPFDEYGLLKEVEAAPATIDEILDDDFLDNLNPAANEIFKIKNIPLTKEIESPDYVAQRKPCKDFHLFEEQFQICQQEIKSEKRRLLPFANEQQIEVGKFFILRGILLLVTEVGERVVKNGKWNARLRCIFENGTESDMLLRSLASELYKDGRRVTLPDDKLMTAMLVTDDDKASGYIYVLRSLSQHPDIKAIPNLYKIGLARQNIETRIQNAANEPTYLMAAVALVSTFQCYNVNLTKLENLLHRFFDPAAAKIQVTDAQGNYHTPKEWFSIPLSTIETAVRLLISGEIVNYNYNPSTGQILLNE